MAGMGHGKDAGLGRGDLPSGTMKARVYCFSHVSREQITEDDENLSKNILYVLSDLECISCKDHVDEVLCPVRSCREKYALL